MYCDQTLSQTERLSATGNLLLQPGITVNKMQGKSSISNNPERVLIPHVTTHAGLMDLCESEVVLGDDLSLSLCYLENLYSLDAIHQNTLSLDEIKNLDSIERADLCVQYIIKRHKTLLSKLDQRSSCDEALILEQETGLPVPIKRETLESQNGRSSSVSLKQAAQPKSYVDLSVVKSEIEHSEGVEHVKSKTVPIAVDTSIVKMETAPIVVDLVKSEVPMEVSESAIKSEVIPVEVDESANELEIIPIVSQKSPVKPEIVTIFDSPIKRETLSFEKDSCVRSSKISPDKTSSSLAKPEIVTSDDFTAKSDVLTEDGGPSFRLDFRSQEFSCQQENPGVPLTPLSNTSGKGLCVGEKLESMDCEESIQSFQKPDGIVTNSVNYIANCPTEDFSTPQQNSDEFFSYDLIAALKAIKSAIEITRTAYALQVKQGGKVANVLFMSLSSLLEMMEQSFQMVFTVTPGAKSWHCLEVISYLVDFVENHNCSSAFYLSVDVSEDEKPTALFRLEELAHCFSGKDVEIRLSNKEYCKPFLHKVAIVGHSYVERFGPPQSSVFACKGDQNTWYGVKKFGVSKASTTSLCKHEVWENLLRYKPHLTILVLGGEDITRTCTPRNIATNVVDLMKVIEKDIGGHCKFIGLEVRTKHPELTPEEFRKIRNAVNCVLKSRMFFSKKRYHSMNMRRNDLMEDGIHLNVEASRRLLKNLLQIAREYFSDKLTPPVAE